MKNIKFSQLLKFQISYKLGLKRIKNIFSQFSHARLSLLGSILLVFVLLFVFLTPFCFVLIQLYKSCSPDNLEKTFFSTVFIFNNIIIFMSALFSSYNIMFSDKDREILTPLPIKKHNIFLCNFIIMYLSAIFSSLFVLLPATIIFFIYDTFSFAILFKVALAIIFSPALSVCIAYFLVSTLLRFVSNFKYKEILAIVMGFLLIFVVILISNNKELLITLNESGKSNFSILNKIFFNSLFFINSICNEGIKGLILLLIGVLISTIFLFLTYLYGGFSYDAICEKYISSSISNKANIIKISISSAENAFLKKEIKTILRSPVYALNCLINIALAPACAYMIYDKYSFFKDIYINYFPDCDFKSFISLIGVYFGFLIMSMSMVPSTTFSREGKNYWITQTMPVSDNIQIKGRIKASITFYMISCFLFFISFGILLKMKILYIIYGLAVCFISSIAFSVCGVLVDFLNPKLIWDKETEAVKQNVNGMIGILLSFILTIIYMVPFILYILEIINIIPTLIFISLLCIASALLSIYILKRFLNRKVNYL